MSSIFPNRKRKLKSIIFSHLITHFRRKELAVKKKEEEVDISETRMGWFSPRSQNKAVKVTPIGRRHTALFWKVLKIINKKNERNHWDACEYVNIKKKM